jgi:predicted nucleic acid-binding protein
MDSQVILCDTNIIIEFYKGNESIVGSIRAIQEQNIAISIVTAAELIYGAMNKQELARISQDIDNLVVYPLTTRISRLHIELLKKYSLSHNLTLPDALIAATAIHHRIELYTLNRKDFRYIVGVKLYQPGA